MSGFDSVGGSSLAIPVDSGGLEHNNNKREEKRKRREKEEKRKKRKGVDLEGVDLG